MKVEEIAEAIAKLPPDQLARFRRRSIPIMRASDELLSGARDTGIGNIELCNVGDSTEK